MNMPCTDTPRQAAWHRVDLANAALVAARTALLRGATAARLAAVADAETAYRSAMAELRSVKS